MSLFEIEKHKKEYKNAQNPEDIEKKKYKLEISI